MPELFERPDQRTEPRKLTDAILYTDWAFKNFCDEKLKTWFAMMRAWDIKLELEVKSICGLDFYGGAPDWIEYDTLNKSSRNDLKVLEPSCRSNKLPLIYRSSQDGMARQDEDAGQFNLAGGGDPSALSTFLSFIF